MYAIVKVGGKQYRVEKGDSLVVDRLRDDEGAKVALEPLLLRSDGDAVFDAEALRKVKVEAVVTGHERGKKVHVLKFKPKRGYKRRSGHRSELTRLEIKDIKMLTRKTATKKAETSTAGEESPSHAEPPAAKGASKPAAKSGSTKSRSTRKTAKEADDGS